MARITIKDNSLLPASNTAQIYIYDAGGNFKAFRFSTGANDFTGPSSFVINIGANSSATLDNIRSAIDAAFSTGSSGGCAGYYDEFMLKNNRSHTISVVHDYNLNGAIDNQIVLLQSIPGSVGNQ